MAKPLSAAQRRVMKWLGYGWTAEHRQGSTIYVNGQKLCNTDTIMSLKRAGLVEQNSHLGWKATAEGRRVTGLLCL